VKKAREIDEKWMRKERIERRTEKSEKSNVNK